MQTDDAPDGMSLAEIGRELGGLSRERVRQIERGALRKLQRALTAKFGPVEIADMRALLRGAFARRERPAPRSDLRAVLRKRPARPAPPPVERDLVRLAALMRKAGKDEAEIARLLGVTNATEGTNT